MERLHSYKRNAILAATLSATALTGCSIDSYLNDTTNVRCDGKRTKTDLAEGSVATFVVRGEDDSVATVQVRRTPEGVSSGVSEGGSQTAQELATDDFTEPIPTAQGAELTALGAGVMWVVDVRADEDSVVIQGSCK